MEQWHRGLTADMFLIRDGRFLTLRRAGNLGRGFEYLPGGLVERGEDPMDAAIRETREECGLVAADMSDEHDAYRWTTPDEYAERWLRPEFDQAFPAYAGLFAQVRRNVDLVRRYL